jgi:HlyD family secretion protein
LLAQYREAHPEVQVKMPESGDSSADKKVVWVKDGNQIYPQEVKVGETDEINYELLSGPKEGTAVIVSMTSVSKKEAKEEAARSPFMPTPPGGNKKDKESK